MKTGLPPKSPLELKFILLWGTMKDRPELVCEHRFAEDRKWRFDFAHLETRIALEVEGMFNAHGKGVGGHMRPKGFRSDCEKYFEAAMLGWRVIRLSPDMVIAPNLERIAEFIRCVETRL